MRFIKDREHYRSLRNAFDKDQMQNHTPGESPPQKFMLAAKAPSHSSFSEKMIGNASPVISPAPTSTLVPP